MNKPIIKFKIKGMPKDNEFNGMSFGRQIEYLNKIKQFCAEAQCIHLSQKRQSYTKAIREAIGLYDIKEYYCKFHSSPEYWDDSFEFWFKA